MKTKQTLSGSEAPIQTAKVNIVLSVKIILGI